MYSINYINNIKYFLYACFLTTLAILFYASKDLSTTQIFRNTYLTLSTKQSIFGGILGDRRLLHDDDLPWWERSYCNSVGEENYQVIAGEDTLYSEFIKLNNLTIQQKTQPDESIKLDKTLKAFHRWKTTVAYNHTCGWRSWNTGYSQKVVSYSVYGDNIMYYAGLDEILSTIRNLYPGWYVRVYINPRGKKSLLCPLVSAHPHLHICDVTSLPPPLGDITKENPRLWRISPLQDPLVNVVVVRDADAKVLQREVDAVNEWLSTGRTLHVMKDHPYHGVPIMGGMWGININEKNRDMMKNVTHTMMLKSYGKTQHQDDQTNLAKTMWPLLHNDSIVHDSYLCNIKHKGFRPFPSQRRNWTFVGNKGYGTSGRFVTLNKTCPVRCRPKEHQDWQYC